MARSIVTHYIDDLDGSIDGVEPVAFTFGGVQYDIDLSKENRERFDRAMAEFVSGARRRRGNPRTRGKLGYGVAKAIRAYAATKPEWERYAKPTGRMPNDLIREYYAWLEAQRADK